jgi:hypothetical protein
LSISAESRTSNPTEIDIAKPLTIFSFNASRFCVILPTMVAGGYAVSQAKGQQTNCINPTWREDADKERRRI